MTLNSYLLGQAAATVAVVAPPGLTLGEWLGLISCGLVLAGVVYRSGVASQKAQNVENLVGGELGKLSVKFDTLIKETQDARVKDAEWKADIGGRVRALEGEVPVHTHQRASDV